MTAKRFTIWELNKSQIEDNVELESYICLNEREAEEVCELLNELHEDNRELNNICNEMGWELSEKGIKIDQLEKENEQLKHQLSQQEMEYVTDCHRLAEENMQLQEELDYYKTKCGSLETALLQGRRAVDKEKEQRMFFVDMEKQRKMFR